MYKKNKRGEFTLQRIFITGIAGFLGFHLTKRFCQEGYYVSGCDLLDTNDDIKQLRIKKLKKLNVHLFDLDCNCIDELKEEFELQKYDVFIHLACKYSRIACNSDRVDASLDAIKTLTKTLEFVCEHQPIKFILASSSAVYNSASNKIVEPESFYGALKLSQELIATSYHNSYGIDLTILRLYSIYGPLGRSDMNYFAFTKVIDENKELTIHSQKGAKRDFFYIDDAVEAIGKSMALSGLNTLNIGSGSVHTKEDLIDAIQKILKRRINILYKLHQFHVLDEIGADTAKTNKTLDFTPKTPFIKGLEQFIAWYQKYKKKYLQ